MLISQKKPKRGYKVSPRLSVVKISENVEVIPLAVTVTVSHTGDTFYKCKINISSKKTSPYKPIASFFLKIRFVAAVFGAAVRENEQLPTNQNRELSSAAV